MQLFLDNYFNIGTILEVYPLLLQGLLMTVQLVFFSVLLGSTLGLLIAVLYSFHNRKLNLLLIAYVDLMRSFPPLVLLILIFYGLPFLGLNLKEFPSAVLAFVLNNSGFYGEVFRAGIESVSKGQSEAARSTGLSALETMAYVILPQAIKNIIPPLTTNTLEVIKGTSIASAVALPELLRSALIAQGLVYNPTPLVMAALTYLILLWPCVRFVARFQRKMMAPR
jgi:polar amino acid transport system permease protein